jgi:hypothetical protein
MGFVYALRVYLVVRVGCFRVGLANSWGLYHNADVPRGTSCFALKGNPSLMVSLKDHVFLIPKKTKSTLTTQLWLQWNTLFP